MAKVQFYSGLYAAYESALKSDDALYFITDTQQIYKGSTLLSDVTELNVEFVASVPQADSAEENKLYVVTDGSGIYIKGADGQMDQVGGGEATSVADGTITFDSLNSELVAGTIGEEPSNQKLPTEEAVKTYVDNLVNTVQSALTALEGTVDSTFKNVAIGEPSSPDDSKFGLVFTKVDNSTLTIDLDKEKYLLKAEIDDREVGDPPETKQCLVLTVQIINPSGQPGSQEVIIPTDELMQVDASTVNTTQTITVTTKVGNYNPGDQISPSSIQSILVNMLSQDKWMGYNAPSMGGSISLTTSAEVGTSVTPSYDCTFNTGSYKTESGAVGSQPSPACPVTSWSATFTGQDEQTGTTETSFSGSFTAVEATETAQTLQVICNYGQATNGPLTFLGASEYDGQTSDTQKIPAGSLKKTATLTGYRSWFTYIGTDHTSAVDSTFIRSSTNRGNSANASTLTNTAIPQGTSRIVVAIPQGGKTLTEVTDVDGMGLSMLSNFQKSTIAVEGANGYSAINYNVWVAENSNGWDATRYTFVIG